MRYKPERALTLSISDKFISRSHKVEMRYKPERALTHHLNPLYPRDYDM